METLNGINDAVDDFFEEQPTIIDDREAGDPGSGEEYVSGSTIDREPGEPKTAKQEPLFDEDDHEAAVEEFLDCNIPEKFDFKLVLTLRATSGNKLPHSVPIASGTTYSDRLEEILKKQFGSAYFVRRLRAIIGDPMTITQKEETTARPVMETLTEGEGLGEPTTAETNESLEDAQTQGA